MSGADNIQTAVHPREGAMRRDTKAVGKKSGLKRRKVLTLKRATRKAKTTETAALKAELRAARDRQTASAEVFRAIATTSGDAANALRRIAEITARLFGASSVTIHIAGEGDRWRQSIRWGTSSARVGHELTEAQLGPSGPNLPATVYRTNRQIHVPDLDRLSPAFARWPTFPIARASGTRSIAGTPLRHKGKAIGVLNVHRNRLAPFSKNELALMQSFADQAVIAIENARLFNETKQALERQTASAEVLQVISASPGDLKPVFDQMLAKAMRLCEAQCGFIYQIEQGAMRAVAEIGVPAAFAEYRKHNLHTGGATTPADVVRATKRPVHVHDARDSEPYRSGNPNAVAGVELGGARTVLYVPMIRNDEIVGLINVYRQEVRPFTGEQIALLENFASQALIAIQNARLFNEVQARTRDLSEALTYQTGSANILSVIASSPTDVQPVLDAIVKSSCELCEAYDAVLVLKEGEELFVGSHYGRVPLNRNRWPNDRGTVSGRAIADRKPVHVSDVTIAAAGFPTAAEMSVRDGGRTVLGIPLMREDESIGAIVLRRTDVDPFNEKQVSLLQTFADQAVIAIGNVRLFNEVQARTRDLQESLRQQTATAEVLKVIATSPTRVGPALQAIVESACKFCDAYDANVLLKEGEYLHYSAHYGPIRTGRGPDRISRQWVVGRSVVDKVPVQVSNYLAPEVAVEFPDGHRSALEQGHRCTLSVPLLRNGDAIGAIVLRRLEPVAFTARQIALLQTFADQAVIAIGNVRLFEEVQAQSKSLEEALQQQTATADVLRVISSTPGVLEPVFNAILENATHICEAEFGHMFLRDGEDFRVAALLAKNSAYPEWLRLEAKLVVRENPRGPLAKIVQSERVVHIADLAAEQSYAEGNARMVALVEASGARTFLGVPMFKDGLLIGVIAIYRQEVRPFAEKQISLVSNFAAQAVIAIENARLLNELHMRTTELSQSLDDLRAAQDRLVQTEKLASLGQLTAGIAHEIKNPLNFVNNFSALSAELIDEMNEVLADAGIEARKREELDEIHQLLKSNLEKVIQHGKRADSIVRNMLLHSREGSGELRAADINGLVEESLNLAYHGARAEKSGFNITLQRKFDPTAGSAELYPQEVTRALLNLISNGFYAATKRENDDAGFEPTVLAETRNRGDFVEIRIRDNGTGIPPELKEKIFIPFFTTKPSGEGTGLGLSMTHDIIVKQHGGSIRVDTEPGEYTEFIVTLPRSTGGQSNQRDAN
jgi:GAF domain-containing protein